MQEPSYGGSDGPVVSRGGDPPYPPREQILAAFL